MPHCGMPPAAREIRQGFDLGNAEIRTIDNQGPAIFSPDGEKVFTASVAEGPILWDAATGKTVRRYEGLAGEPYPGQAEAIAEMEKIGGKVAVDEKRPGKPVISVVFHGGARPRWGIDAAWKT